VSQEIQQHMQQAGATICLQKLGCRSQSSPEVCVKLKLRGSLPISV